MTCAIMQPTFLPWLGYFDLIKSVDKFVIYDNVQFEKQSWQQRNRVRNKEGEILLVIPVCYENGLNRNIKDTKISYARDFVKKHIKTLSSFYFKSPNYSIYIDTIIEIYEKKHTFLIDMNIDFINFGRSIFGIKTEILFASDLNPVGDRVEKLIDICKKLDCDHYLSPLGSQEYIEANNLFSHNSIKLSYQNFLHPIYKQINYNDFISHLSFIDYIFNFNIPASEAIF